MNPVKIDPEIMHGTPCFAGTRVPVQALFDFLDHDRSIGLFLEEFPSVKLGQVLETLRLSRDALVANAVIVKPKSVEVA